MFSQSKTVLKLKANLSFTVMNIFVLSSLDVILNIFYINEYSNTVPSRLKYHFDVV